MSQASILRIAVCALLVSASGCGKADSTASAGARGTAPGQGTAADKAGDKAGDKAAKKADEKVAPRPRPRVAPPARAGKHLAIPAGVTPKMRAYWAAEFKSTPPVGELGGPRPGLTAKETLDFVRGRALFRDGPGIEGGLGPTYVQTSCGQCHGHPEIGGEGNMKRPLKLTPKPAEKDVHIVRYKAIPGHTPEAIPAGTTVSERRAPMLFGVGLMEAIKPETIAAGADPDDRDGDGVRGRHNKRSAKLSRWGLKAHDLTLRRVIVGSLFLDLGLTTNEQPHMRSDEDKVADPEADDAMIALYEAYVGNLAPPPRGPITDAVKAGEKIFADAGCGACHVADLGPAKGIYSNLLIHDLGKDNGDGLDDSLATSTDWRTAPLWGLRHRKAYFHNHRAKTLTEAIDLHRGEAQKSRDAAMALDDGSKALLLAFLKSL